jgi:predicted MFS family arabinose efflux permease
MDTELNTEKKILGWGRYEFTILWWFFILWGAVFLDRLVMPFLAPLVMEDLGVTDLQYGLINTFTTGCYAISAIVITPIFESTGKRKKWLVMLCLGAGIFACLGAATQNVWQLLITRAVVGFCEGPIVSIIFAMLLKESSSNRIALNSGIINMGVSVIAIAIGTPLVTQIAAASSWRMGFLVAGIISIVISIVLMKVLREVPFSLESQGEKKESIMSVLGKLMKNRNVVICFILGVLTMLMYWTLMLYSTLFFTSEGGVDITGAGFIVGLTGAMGIAWTVVVPKISDFLGRKPALIMWYAIYAVVPFMMFGAPSSFSAMLLYMLIGAIPGSIFPFFQAIIPGESLPNYMLGTASGLIIGVSEIVGGSAWPAVAGVIAGNAGYPTVILSAGIAAVIAIFITLFLKETKGKNAERLQA